MRVRFEMLDKVLYDNQLSIGARFLYVALDRRAGPKGVTWPKQSTLACAFDVSLAQIKRWIAELRAAGYLTIERHRAMALYTLAWISITPQEGGEPEGDDIEMAHPRAISDVQIAHPRAIKIAHRRGISALSSLYEPGKEKQVSKREELESQSVSSTTAVAERPTDPLQNQKPTPTPYEPKTRDARLLKGLRNRRAAVEEEGIFLGGILEERPREIDSDLVYRLIAIMPHVPEWAFWEVLDEKIREKVQRREPYFARWLPTAARDAVKAWEARHEVIRKPPQPAPVDAFAAGMMEQLAQSRMVR